MIMPMRRLHRCYEALKLDDGVVGNTDHRIQPLDRTVAGAKGAEQRAESGVKFLLGERVRGNRMHADQEAGTVGDQSVGRDLVRSGTEEAGQ